MQPRTSNPNELPREETIAGRERLESLDEMLAYIAHEIRNPLTVLKCHAGNLRARAHTMSRAELDEATLAIERNVKNLDLLLTSLTDVRAISGEGISLRLTRTLISKIVQDTMADLESLTRTHEVTVHIEDDAVVNLDVVRIRQVLTNLISNAVKFSPEGTPVELTVRRNDNQVQVTVQDQGPGIPEHRVDELFQKFSRLGSETGGMGLGLWVSRGIVREHGGDLRVADNSIEGCAFVLSLPINGTALGDHWPA
jgi:signal transduction histidine kinase